MPATYHFKPFPNPGEAHYEITPRGTSLQPTLCACPSDNPQCPKCRQIARDIPVIRSKSQAILSPIKEHSDPVRSGLTPKQIRDRRRASSRVSVGAALQSAVSSDDDFTLFPNIRPRESGRSSSSSASSSRSRSTLRHASSSSDESSESSRSILETDYSPMTSGFSRMARDVRSPAKDADGDN